ncbi:MAG: hypothetical protein WCI95_00720 [bacterium]
MELIPIECGNCMAKLKIKAMPARMPTEVKCPKCGKPIPVGKGAKTASAAIPAPAAPPSPIPVAATPAVPVSTPPPIPAPAVAPASSTAQLTPPPKPIQQPSVSQPANPVKKAAAPIVLGQVPEASNGANISVICPSCQWQTKVSQTLIGKKIRCKQCSGIIPVSSPDQATEEPVVAAVTTPSPEPLRPVEPQPLQAPIPFTPVPVPQTTSPAPLTIPAAQAIPPEVPPSAAPVSTPKISSGTTMLVEEIATLKTKLETALKDSSQSVMRLAEAEQKVQYAEMRTREAERTLHDMAGKAAIDTMTTNRKITELEAKIVALNQTLSSATSEFGSELEQAEKRVARLKEIMASHRALAR